MSGRLSFRDAMELVDDSLPDGAYWAMCHEMAGLDYGEGFVDLLPPAKPKKGARALRRHEQRTAARTPGKPHRCGTCGKDFKTKGAKAAHRRDAHPAASAQQQEPRQ